jgi:hypothetical protein
MGLMYGINGHPLFFFFLFLSSVLTEIETWGDKGGGMDDKAHDGR